MKSKDDQLPPESFFRHWRIDHGSHCEWVAEAPDWGRTVEAKTLRGLINKMRKLAEKVKKRCPRCKGELMFCGCYDRRESR